MANIFATLIITSDLLAKIDPAKELGLDLRLNDAWGSFVTTAYEHTHAFCYNPFHAQALDVVYAGGERLDWPQSPEDIWVDYVLVRNRVLDLASLHVHLRFPDIGIDLSDPDERLTAVIAFIRDGLWSADHGPTSIPRLQRMITRNLSQKQRRRSSLPFSRYSYVSVIRPVASKPGTRATQHENEQGSIYRLLFLTENAISPKLARGYNDTNSWSAEEFFRVYHQPGGLVTVAEPYPSSMQAKRRTGSCQGRHRFRSHWNHLIRWTAMPGTTITFLSIRPCGFWLCRRSISPPAPKRRCVTCITR